MNIKKEVRQDNLKCKKDIHLDILFMVLFVVVIYCREYFPPIGILCRKHG